MKLELTLVIEIEDESLEKFLKHVMRHLFQSESNIGELYLAGFLILSRLAQGESAFDDFMASCYVEIEDARQNLVIRPATAEDLVEAATLLGLPDRQDHLAALVNQHFSLSASGNPVAEPSVALA